MRAELGSEWMPHFPFCTYFNQHWSLHAGWTQMLTEGCGCAGKPNLTTVRWGSPAHVCFKHPVFPSIIARSHHIIIATTCLHAVPLETQSCRRIMQITKVRHIKGKDTEGATFFFF